MCGVNALMTRPGPRMQAGQKGAASGIRSTRGGKTENAEKISTPIIAGGERKIKMELSEQDKTIIANAMYDIFFDLEGAKAVLWAAHEIYFHDDQKDIPASAAVTLGQLLDVYLGLTNSVIEQYKEIVGG